MKQLPEKGPQLPRGSTSPGNPAQNQPGSPPQLAQGLSQESQRHIFRLSLSLESLVFRLKSQEEPVHNNKDGFSLCSLLEPGVVLWASVFPSVNRA